MSHTTHIKSVPLRDANLIEKAVTALQAKGINCQLLQNVKPRMFYANQHVSCDLVLNLKDCPYDVGFEKNEDGVYEMVYDEWAGHVAKHIGAKCAQPTDASEKSAWGVGQFIQQYSKEAILEQAELQGMILEYVNELDNGELEVSISVMN